jgi:hypothetical protein
MMSGEELSFKVPPKMSFTTLTTHVLTSDMITSPERPTLQMAQGQYLSGPGMQLLFITSPIA